METLNLSAAFSLSILRFRKDTNMNKQNKSITWRMRAAQTDKAHIATLAKRLGCKESEAVRRAIRYTLATMPKTAKVKR
jgi:hypothetical protein